MGEVSIARIKRQQVGWGSKGQYTVGSVGWGSTGRYTVAYMVKQSLLSIVASAAQQGRVKEERA